MDKEIQLLIHELNAVVIYGKLDDYGHAIFPPILHGTAVIYEDAQIGSVFMIILGIIALFYGSIILGSIILIIWTIRSRIKEKKREKIDHEKYKKY